MAIGMVAVGIVWGLYGFIIQPTRNRIETLQRLIPEKQEELRSMQARSAEYLALRRASESLESRIARQDADFQLLPFLESLIEQHQLSDNLITMEPETLSAQHGYSETIVEIGLEGVALRQLVDFLEAIETSDVMAQIGSLYIRKDAQDATRLTSTLQIHCPRVDSDAASRVPTPS